jgi:hypothetical protein
VTITERLLTTTALLAFATVVGAQEPSPTPSPGPTPITPQATPPPVPAASPSPTPAVDLKPAVQGYAQIDYRFGDHGGSTGAVNQEWNVRRARIGIVGKVARRVGYNFVVQGDGLNANSASLLDVSVDIDAFDWLKFRAGQYKYEFDLEGREADHANPLPDRSFATNAVAGSLNGASTPSSPLSAHRDRGLTALATRKLGGTTVVAAIGVFQGTGRASDNNDSLAVTANLNVTPIDAVTIGGGYLHSATEDQGKSASSYEAFVVGAAYDKGRAFLRGEYYAGRRDATSKIELAGYYLTGAYRVLANLDLVGRYEAFTDEQFTTGGDEVRSFDVSARYYFARRNQRSGTHVSLTYMFRDADAGFKKGMTLLNDGRGVALDDGALVGNALIARVQVQF